MSCTKDVWKLLESHQLSLVNIFDSNQNKNRSEELIESFMDLLKTTLNGETSPKDETSLDVGRIIGSLINLAFPPKNDSSHISNNIPQLRNNKNSGYLLLLFFILNYIYWFWLHYVLFQVQNDKLLFWGYEVLIRFHFLSFSSNFRHKFSSSISADIVWGQQTSCLLSESGFYYSFNKRNQKIIIRKSSFYICF